MTMEESLAREPNEPAAPEVGEIRASRGASITAADLIDHAGRLDDVAGSEFVDDRIRLPE